jgi:hypothetical protein
MPLPRPRIHATGAERQKAYRERVAQQKKQQGELAELARQISAGAAAAGLVPLLSSDDVEAAKRVLQFVQESAPKKTQRQRKGA